MHSLLQSVQAPVNAHSAEETTLTIGDLTELFRYTHQDGEGEGEEEEGETVVLQDPLTQPPSPGGGGLQAVVVKSPVSSSASCTMNTTDTGIPATAYSSMITSDTGIRTTGVSSTVDTASSSIRNSADVGISTTSVSSTVNVDVSSGINDSPSIVIASSDVSPTPIPLDPRANTSVVTDSAISFTSVRIPVTMATPSQTTSQPHFLPHSPQPNPCDPDLTPVTSQLSSQFSSQLSSAEYQSMSSTDTWDQSAGSGDLSNTFEFDFTPPIHSGPRAAVPWVPSSPYTSSDTTSEGMSGVSALPSSSQGSSLSQLSQDMDR